MKTLLTRLGLAILAALFLIVSLAGAAAANGSQLYYRGRVVSAPQHSGGGVPIEVKLIEGPEKDQIVSAPATGLNSASDISLPTYKQGDEVIVAVSFATDTPTYSVLDHYRFPGVMLLVGAVIISAIIFGRRRGLGALVGLAISLVVLGGYVIPQIRSGQNPYTVAVLGSFVIATLTIFFAHGYSRRTVLALFSTYISLLLATGLAALAVWATHLNGIATEDVAYLHQQLPALNIRGLLLGGIIIGLLGVLDDVTVGQAAAVEEIHKANTKLGWQELYQRGLVVGREHIASLINTLVLAYAGTSFIFIIYVASVLNLPVWLTLNSELVVGEIVRSLVGSFALILAVPIATFLAAYFLSRSNQTAQKT